MAEERTGAAALRAALDRSAHESGRGRRPPSRVVHGTMGTTWDVVARACATTRDEFASLDDPSYLTRAAVPESVILRGPQTLQPLIGRGVRVRQLTTYTGLQADAKYGTIMWRSGSEARVVKQLPFKACVIDRSVALIPLDLSVLAHGFLIVRDPAVIDTVLSQHATLWADGEHPSSAVPDSPPPVHLQLIVPLLASGASDEAGARRAGISTRTYSRRVAELMTMMGVRSRFQAGIEAARRGWV